VALDLSYRQTLKTVRITSFVRRDPSRRALLYFNVYPESVLCPKAERIRVVIPARLTKWAIKQSGSLLPALAHVDYLQISLKNFLCLSASNNLRMILLLSDLFPSCWIQGFPPIVGIRWLNLFVLAVAPALALYGFITLPLRKETMFFSLSYYIFSTIGDRLS